MPLYDYRCSTCRHGFEVRRSMADASAAAACPACGSADTVKSYAVNVAVARGTGRSAAGAGGCGSCKPRAGGCGGCGSRR